MRGSVAVVSLLAGLKLISGQLLQAAVLRDTEGLTCVWVEEDTDVF